MRFLTLACCLSLASWAAAQDVSGLSEYQQGAGAYFAGRGDQAEEHLTAALESDPNDIRAYYLRGLNRMNEGDLVGAQADLTKGAELEAQRGSSPLIDQSLSAVQGSARVTLERVRRSARRSAELQERRAMMQAVKQQREQQEQRVLRTNFELPMEALASRLTVDQARQVAVKVKPSLESAVADTAKAPTAEIEADSDNPFADDTYNEDRTFATSSQSGDSGDVDIPAAARGSVDAGTLFGIVGDTVGDAVGHAVESGTRVFSGVVPPMGPGAPPPGMMDGGANQFGAPAGGQAFPADGQAFPAGAPAGMDGSSAPQPEEGDDPFALPDEDNPFNFEE